MAVLVAAALVLWAPVSATAQCTNDGTGRYYYTTSDYIDVNGGQVSMAGATLFVDFFRQQSSTNDWIDVDFNGWSGYDSTCDPPPCNVYPPYGVDFLSSLFLPGFNLDTHWAFQYRSIGSVNGFNEFVANQTCGVIPFTPPSENGIFNVGFEWASGGSATFSPAANYSGTPLEPCEIEGAFLDVPSSWAIQVGGSPDWNRAPLADGYGLGSGILSTAGVESRLQTLSRDCGVCVEVSRVRRTNTTPNGLRDANLCMNTLTGPYQECSSVGTSGTVEAIPCVSDGDCPWFECHNGVDFTGVRCGPNPAYANACEDLEECLPRDTCNITTPGVSLNKDFVTPDADTVYDYVGAWVPVSIIANRGVNDDGIKFSEAQQLFTTGRMPNGENLVAATRDVGSGTRNAAMNSLGIDTSWGRGDNLGKKESSSSTDPLGPLFSVTNRGGSSRMEGTVQNSRLAVGYTGLAGTSRSGLDAQKGKYEIMGVCKDVDENGDPLCNCDTTGYVRPSVDTVLDNCDPCTGYQIAGSGSFVVRGDIDANRWGYCNDEGPPTLPDGGDAVKCWTDDDCTGEGNYCVNPGYVPPSDPGVPLDNQAVADYLINIFDSVASFEQELVLPGECLFSGDQCSTDADCPVRYCCSADENRTCTTPGDPCWGFCDDETTQCDDNGDCAGVGSEVCNGYDGTCQECLVQDVCKRKLNMPGQYLATTFFLSKGLDCVHVLDNPLVYEYELDCCSMGQCSTSLDPCDIDNPCPTGEVCEQIPCVDDDDCTGGFGTCDPCPANQELQDFMRANNGLGWGALADGSEYDYGINNPGGDVPLRTPLSGTRDVVYSDGSRTNYYFYDGASYVTVAGYADLSVRNAVQADFNNDGIRDVDDVGTSCGTDPQELVKAWSTPREWSASTCAEDAALGRLDPDFKRPEDPTDENRMFAGSAIPEVLGDYDGNGNFSKEDLRYWMDGLAMNDDGSGRELDRKAGAIAIDNALISDIQGMCTASNMCFDYDISGNGSLTPDVTCVATGDPCGVNGICVAQRCDTAADCHLALDECVDFLPWAEYEEALWVNFELANGPWEPQFKRPTPISLMKATGTPYNSGDFRGDINGRKVWACTLSGLDCFDDTDCDPVTYPGDVCDTEGRDFIGGAQPMRWDGRIDHKDINYIGENLRRINGGPTRQGGLEGKVWGEPPLTTDIYWDLSTDIDGDLDVDTGDIYELVVNVLGTQIGDANLDGVLDATDETIADAGTADPCNDTATCGWEQGDFNGDGHVDAADLSVFTTPCTMVSAATLPAGESGYATNRFLAFAPGNPGVPTAVRVTITGMPAAHAAMIGEERWVGPTSVKCENAGVDNPPCPSVPLLPDQYLTASLECSPTFTDFGTDFVNVSGVEVFAPGEYRVEVISQACYNLGYALYSAPITVSTAPQWADTVGNCTVIPCTPPDGTVNITTDVTASLDKFKNLPGSVLGVRVDIEPQVVDHLINITDVTTALDAFLGITTTYPFAVPDNCP
jgi:hypothetical protein